jgi:hypothetical protein
MLYLQIIVRFHAAMGARLNLLHMIFGLDEELLLVQAEMLQNMSGQHVVDFGMARDRLLLAIRWIQVNIVSTTMAM